MGAEGQELEAESVKSVEEVTLQPKKQSFSSVRSLCSYTIDVTQQMMELSAEALSRTGRPQHSDTEETVRKMAAMKIQSVVVSLLSGDAFTVSVIKFYMFVGLGTRIV